MCFPDGNCVVNVSFANETLITCVFLTRVTEMMILFMYTRCNVGPCAREYQKSPNRFKRRLER
jgi:hypothetical protein